jgi:nicotinamidase-related amidase
MSRRLQREEAVLVVIDIQEKLTPHIDGHQELEENVDRLVRGCHVLGVPALLTEQYPKGIGPTTRSVTAAFDETYGTSPVEKSCFSSYDCREFADRLNALGRRQVLLCGIEAHVCVYQTALDLLDGGFGVWVVADAVSSRSPRNREIALRRLEQEGAKLSSVEMALFELTVESGTDEFRSISRLVK